MTNKAWVAEIYKAVLEIITDCGGASKAEITDRLMKLKTLRGKIGPHSVHNALKFHKKAERIVFRREMGGWVLVARS